MPTHDELRDDEAQYAAFLAKMCDFYRNGNTCPNANRSPRRPASRLTMPPLLASPAYSATGA
jgi:hypothetical protein